MKDRKTIFRNRKEIQKAVPISRRTRKNLLFVNNPYNLNLNLNY